MVMTMDSAGVTSAAALFRGLLSDRALAELEHMKVVRDPAKTCDAQTLRRVLEERGLPVYQSVLQFEERCGGVHGSGDRAGYMGTFAVLPLFDVRWSRSPGEHVQHDRVMSYQGRLLLPITHGCVSEYWMDENGVIYFVDEDVDECSPDTVSYVHFLEQWALWNNKERLGAACQRFVIKRSVGSAIANALDLPCHLRASDGYSTWWIRDADYVIDRFERYFCYATRRETIVQLASMDDVVGAVRTATAQDPQLRMDWHGPNGPPPAAGEPIVARVGWHDYRVPEAVGEILFIGSPGNFRVHRYYHEKYKYFDHGSFVWADYGKPVAEFASPADWPGRQRPYKFSASVRVGAAVARALNAVPVEPASKSGELSWTREGIEIKQQEPREGVASSCAITRVSAPTVEDVIRAMEATLAAEPRAPLWWDSDNRMPPGEGEPIVRRFPKYNADGTIAGEILIIGRSGDYRVHSRWCRA